MLNFLAMNFGWFLGSSFIFLMVMMGAIANIDEPINSAKEVRVWIRMLILNTILFIFSITLGIIGIWANLK
jgi:hypothetical protein